MNDVPSESDTKSFPIPLLNECLVSDCVAFMENNFMYPDSRPKLIVMDPPYNYGQQYAAYDDNDPAFTVKIRRWITTATRFLANDGALVMFIPDEWVSFVDTVARHECFLHRRSWIVWYYTFGVSCARNFARSHTHILYFTKSKIDYIFNMDPVPSKRQRMGDKRAAPGGKHPDNVWILQPEQLPDAGSDTWLESRICGTFKERQPHSPNQLPLPIIRRLVKVLTNESDLVYDAFLGTGTTGVICKELSRKFLGTDVSIECVEKSRERIGNKNDCP